MVLLNQCEVNMKTSDIFEKEIGFIQNEDIQRIVVDTLNASPKCIQTIPASSSGKYHPKADLGEQGLVRHIKTVTAIANTIFGSNCFRDMIFGADVDTSTAEYYEKLIMYQDAAIAACILHDCYKASDDDEKHTTQFNHPLLAANLFKQCAKKYINADNMEYMKQIVPLIHGAIASHMGKWSSAKYAPNIILPEPKNPLENFVHLCDYIASRKIIDFNFEEYENSFQ